MTPVEENRTELHAPKKLTVREQTILTAKVLLVGTGIIGALMLVDVFVAR